MSQANWIEYFQNQRIQQPEEQQKRSVPLPAWVTDWGLWVTFALAVLVFLSVARSVQRANWVDGMPSLTLLSFLGLLTGLLLSRIRWPEPALHVLALLIGAPIVLWLTLGYIHSPTLMQSLGNFWHRYGDWIYQVRTGGISTDVMPFVSMVLALTWIASYLSSWSIFRWHNAWLALVPGGVGLLTNISYLPGQNSIDFLLFLFGAMLLVMRVNMRNREQDWQRRGLPYPSFVSLNVLNATVWVVAALLFVAWTIPLATEAPGVSQAWNSISSPFSNATDWSRLFSSIDSKRDVPLHNFGSTLPLQGKVVLSDRPVAEVDFGDQVDYGRNLRAAVYDQYTPQGWKSGPRQTIDIGPSGLAGAPAASKNPQPDRTEVPVTVTVDSPLPVLLTLGQPETSSLDAHAEVIHTGTDADIAAVRSKSPLKTGESYTLKGVISQASVESLQGAQTNYPDWVKSRYLQLPTELPARIRALAEQWTAGKTNPYDKATAIQDALRNYTETYDIPAVPPDRDAVDYFLFDLKRGYADYHASAMVVMLRTLGVPARLATGFSIGNYDNNLHRYVIEEKDATSWPEVYFPGYGWEDFSPFGGSPLVNRPTVSADNSQAADSADTSADTPDDTTDNTGDSGGAAAVLNHGSHRYEFLLYGGGVLLALVGLAGVGALGFRFAWEKDLSGLDYPVQLWEKTIRLGSWLKVAPRPEQTPSEYSKMLRQTLPDAEHVDTIANGYLRSRFGHKPLDADERQYLAAAWSILRNRLVRHILHWKG